MSDPSDFIIENGVLTKYVGPGGDVVIPDGVTEIRGAAFERCKTVSRVSIPSSVEFMGYERGEEWYQPVFAGCSSLCEIRFLGHTGFVWTASEKWGGHPKSTLMRQYPQKLVIVAPFHRLAEIPDASTKVRMTFGYSQNRALFSDSIEQEYSAYIKKNKKNLAKQLIENDDAVTLKDLLDYSPQKQEFIDACLELSDNHPEIRALLLMQKSSIKSDMSMDSFSVKELERDPFSPSEMKKIWNYVVHEDGNLAIKKYKGHDTEIIIPDRIGKKTVAHISTKAFQYNDQIISVRMPDTILSVGLLAFADCKNLKSVVLSAQILEITSDVFFDCENLEELHIAKKTKIINIKSLFTFSLSFCPKLTIISPSGSAAEKYAGKNKIPFVAE